MSGQSQAAANDVPREETKAGTLKAFIEREGIPRLKEIASKYVTPEEIVRLTLLASSRQPLIFDCTNASILSAMMDAAVVGIRPGGVAGRGYLVPRWSKKVKGYELCFDPGFRGLMDIARRSGKIDKFEAHVRYERDVWRHIKGTEPKLIHEPADVDRGGIVGAYAVVWFLTGTYQFEVMTEEDLAMVSAVSTSRDRDTKELVGPWVDWTGEMVRKSAVRRLCKYLPYAEDLDRAIAMSDKADGEIGEIREASAAIVVATEVPATSAAAQPEAAAVPIQTSRTKARTLQLGAKLQQSAREQLGARAPAPVPFGRQAARPAAAPEPPPGRFDDEAP